MSIVSVSYSVEEKSLIPLVILGPAQCDNGSCHLPHAPVTQQLSPLDLAYPLPPSPTFPYFGAARGHGRTILYKVREGIRIAKRENKYKYLLQSNGCVSIKICFVSADIVYAGSRCSPERLLLI